MGNNQESENKTNKPNDWEIYGAATGTNKHMVPPQQDGPTPPRLDGSGGVSGVQTTHEKLKQIPLLFDIFPHTLKAKHDPIVSSIFKLDFELWSKVPVTVILNSMVTIETDPTCKLITKLKPQDEADKKKESFTEGLKMSANHDLFTVQVNKYSVKQLFSVERTMVPLALEIIADSQVEGINRLVYLASFKLESMDIKICGKCNLYLT